MSVSSRVLLFAAVAMGITCVLSVGSLYGARTGRQIRERVVASQEQLEGLGRLNASVWPYLNALSRARESGQDTLLILRQHEAQVLGEQVRFLAHLEQEGDFGNEGEVDPREEEREEFDRAVQGLLRWMARTEQRLRLEPARGPIAPALEWGLYQDYAQEVGTIISAIQASEQEEMTQLRARWDLNMQRSQRFTKILTISCVVLMTVLALFILLPLRGSLRKLRTTAERIGGGDFDVVLPAMGQDELGLLARAMDRMARELRGTLQEKQRLIQAEAEVAEREARRYSGLLEETVRARTAELETANTRLGESLQQLQTTQERLLFADRLAVVGRLAAGVGHEINNPLSYILSNLRFIHSELQRPEAAALPEREELLTAATDARDGAERVRLIVQDLRMLSRPDDVALGPVGLEGVIHGAAKIASQELKHRARLREECQGVPMVWGNGPRLGQVVLNLLINAAHSIDPGHVEENEVCVMARAHGEESVILEVSDTGGGISPENLGRIFEPFFTTKPVGVGTGLGLSVCRSIITSMGGTITVESELGRGTTFRIILPRAERKSGEAPQKQVS